MNEPKTAEETITLHDAIEQLDQISWRINALVFGEQVNGVAAKETPFIDKLTYEKGRVLDINRRLAEVEQKLEIIGK